MYKSAEEISKRKFIGIHATIQTVDNKTHVGYIYVVDPESKSVVLTTQKTEHSSGDLIIITAPTIKNIQIDTTQDIGEINIFSEKRCQSYSIQDLQEKKKKLKDWLKLNLIDVVEDGEALKFQDHLIIEPPYDLDHCYCTNTIVLDRFKSLIEKMPV
ncbi:gem-associated protein 6-like [Atheta coriaria]|uniref:gem-associated protein 6-like n=1 Tax=Dalotia coriaria TaxID=877792 RepID=UPI0031F3FB6F